MQNNKQIDFSAGLGQAVREYQTDVGPADYVLFVDKKAVAVIEAKREEVGYKITDVETQTEGYANATLKWVKRDDLEMSPFDAQGGLGKMYQLFGDKMDSLIDELNEALVA